MPAAREPNVTVTVTVYTGIGGFEIAQSYVVPAFERGASRRAGACEGGGGCGLCILAVVVLGSG